MKYKLDIGPVLDAKITIIANRLAIDTDEVLRMAIELIYAATEADEIILRKNGEDQKVLIK